MKVIGIVLGLVVLAVVGFYGSIMIASETGGEVVTLRTRDADDRTHETRVWVVEHDGAAWLRAGGEAQGWMKRMRAEPQVEVERDGMTEVYKTLPTTDSATVARINELMKEKYGFADGLIDLIRDPSQVVAIRLEPILQ